MTHAIVSTGAMDGACSAAAIWSLHEDAKLWVTSQHVVDKALVHCLHQQPRPDHVHVCGVGLKDVDRVCEALAALKQAGIQATWYCGRGYLDAFRERLAEQAQVRFEPADSNTAVICRALDLPEGPVRQRLESLAAEFVGLGKGGKPGPSWLHWFDLVQESSDRFFQFHKEEAFFRVVRQLAGLLPVSEDEKRAAAEYRKLKGLRRKQEALLGTSAVMDELRRRIERVAPLKEPVLLLGPTGTGKDLVARTLHLRGGKDRKGTFVPFNCSLFSGSADLAQDKLLGHVQGAFTGASTSAIGAFEEATGGTLFLDEVAEIPLSFQPTLLRLLEDQLVTPLGSREPRSVDVRVVAATNRDLPALVRRGEFRLDLFHRLHVLPLHVPPLRERFEDVPALVEVCLRELEQEGLGLELGREDLEAIRDYDWPGNVRQLRNLIKRAACLGQGLRCIIAEEKRLGVFEGLENDGLSEPQRRALALMWPAGLNDARPEADLRRAYCEHVLKLAGGKVAAAAEVLGISVNTLRRRLP